MGEPMTRDGFVITAFTLRTIWRVCCSTLAAVKSVSVPGDVPLPQRSYELPCYSRLSLTA